MNFLAIIPARYASSRFPGKPLVEILGKPMIQHVYERTAGVLETLVATDDERILQAVQQFGGNAVMTGSHHPSGTDRCYEALTLWEEKTETDFDVVINIQGDEPAIHPGQIRELIACFDEPSTQIATLIHPINNTDDLFNPNIPKVVTDRKQHALYFSRLPVPYLRDYPEKEWVHHHTFYRHIGLYGFQRDILEEITSLSPSLLEKAEALEQLRWLVHGYPITTQVTSFQNQPVDTPDDIKKAITLLSGQR